MNPAMLTDTVAEADRQAREEKLFLQHVVLGLSLTPKALSSRYFYDAVGSRIFEEIMALPEYYLTRSEASILSARREEILEAMDGGLIHLIDLGAGNGEKTRFLIDHFHAWGSLINYVPVDISGEALRHLARNLLRDFPGLKVKPLEDGYLRGLDRFRPDPRGKRLVLFLGSNIGNFGRAESVRFLRDIRARLAPGDGLLVGFDLRKHPETILRAYDDAAGVTARFNLNLLERINRELEGDFDLGAFRHQAVYDDEDGAARSYLVSLASQQVHIGKARRSFAFGAGEAVHTENSYKFSRVEIAGMAHAAGFRIEAEFTDNRGYFLDSLLRVP